MWYVSQFISIKKHFFQRFWFSIVRSKIARCSSTWPSTTRRWSFSGLAAQRRKDSCSPAASQSTEETTSSSSTPETRELRNWLKISITYPTSPTKDWRAGNLNCIIRILSYYCKYINNWTKLKQSHLFKYQLTEVLFLIFYIKACTFIIISTEENNNFVFVLDP